jgi:hypothetical protein
MLTLSHGATRFIVHTKGITCARSQKRSTDRAQSNGCPVFLCTRHKSVRFKACMNVWPMPRETKRCRHADMLMRLLQPWCRRASSQSRCSSLCFTAQVGRKSKGLTDTLRGVACGHSTSWWCRRTPLSFRRRRKSTFRTPERISKAISTAVCEHCYHRVPSFHPEPSVMATCAVRAVYGWLFAWVSV